MFRLALSKPGESDPSHRVARGAPRDDPRATRNRIRESHTGHGIRDITCSTAEGAVTERGSVLPFVAGMLALAGIFAVGVLDSTNLALARTGLQSLADGAALAAAQSVNPTTVTLTPDGPRFSLTTRGVRADARAYLRDSASAGVRVVAVSVPDSRTAVVTLARVWRAPLDNDFFPLRMTLTATARARTVFG